MVRPLKMAALLLSVCPLLNNACFNLPTYLPQALATDYSCQMDDEGHVSLKVFPVTDEPTWCKSPLSLVTSPPRRLLSCPDHRLLHMVGCSPRPLLQMCELPHPLNHWCLCCWLQALSLVLKLGKQRPYGPVGFRTALGQASSPL